MSSDSANFFINRDKELRGFCKLLKPETPQAVMLIEAGELMGKTWLINQMTKRCHEEIETAPTIIIDFKDEQERHAVQDTLSLVRLIQEKLGYPDAFTYLNTVINAFTFVQRPIGIAALMPLIEQIEDTYDLERLERLAMWLDVAWENLSGDTKFQKVKELVLHFQRLGTFSQLMERLEEERPHIDWKMRFKPLLSAATPRNSTHHQDTPFDHTVKISIPTESRDLVEAQINKAFLTCLEKFLANVSPIVFLFDGCEEAPDEAERWIREQLVDRLSNGELKGVIMIFAARKVPYQLDVAGTNVAVKTVLDGFDESRAREFFEVHSIQVDSDELPILVASSGGQPGMLARMVDNLRAQKDKEDPFFQ